MTVVLVIIAAVAVLALLVGVHLYVWRRLVRDTTRSGLVRRVGAGVVIALGVSMAGALVLPKVFGPRGTEWIAWPGFVWMALLLYVVMALGVLEVPRVFALRALRRRGAGERAAEVPRSVPVAVGADGDAVGEVAELDARSDAGPPVAASGTPLGPDRRLVLSRSVALLAAGTSMSAVGYGMTQALGAPRTVRVRIPVARLDPRLAGFRIAVVGDIHLGPLLGRAHTTRVVETINRTNPDLVAIVGDLADGTAGQLGDDAAPLRRLTSRYGSFFVTGNHDYMSGAADWVAELAELNVHTLANDRLEIARGGAAFDLAGVNDISGKSHHDGPNFAKALGNRDPSRPVVLLAHQPVQVDDAAKYDVDVQLSGHTHGGQMFPVQFLVKLDQPAVAGLHRVDDTMLYITRGAGFWGPPVRLGAPPEVTVVELHPK
ncbi:metallophosphoesterase [Embleya sp. NBC_00888]|uniref:metallophosphoesterase n=1 Tax=Embleya sp. NBC_00888 TaxID=2975960 RepID=UPI00386594E8|nr:metallophosphoesterase [Embleya sp. NBC_00888]